MRKDMDYPSGHRVIAAVLLIMAAVVCSYPAPAGELPRQAVLPLEMAHKAVRAAVNKCRQDGYGVSAAVVDVSGVLRALSRGDGAGPHTVDSSRRKAYTAVSLGVPTQELAGLIAKNPRLQALRDMNESILILGGGFPVRIDGEVVAGLGVGGAPGAHLDAACARAGLGSIDADTYESE